MWQRVDHTGLSLSTAGLSPYRSYATPCFNHFSPSQYFYMLHTSVASSLEEAWNCKFVLDEGGNVIDHAGMEMCLSITTVWRKLMRVRPKT